MYCFTEQISSPSLEPQYSEWGQLRRFIHPDSPARGSHHSLGGYPHQMRLRGAALILCGLHLYLQRQRVGALLDQFIVPPHPIVAARIPVQTVTLDRDQRTTMGEMVTAEMVTEDLEALHLHMDQEGSGPNGCRHRPRRCHVTALIWINLGVKCYLLP